MTEITPDYKEYYSRRFFGSLDGFRCICIVAVIWHHTNTFPVIVPALERGYLGVDMFFVISGFLIVTLLLRERERTGNISLWRFYMRRALRIFPLYYGLLTLLTLIFIFVAPQTKMAKPFFEELPYYITYTSNWIHPENFLVITWSLATEEQFYIVWPLVEKLIKRTSTIAAFLLAIIGINQLISFRLLDHQLETWFGISYSNLNILQITFTPICLGVLLAHVLHSPKGFQQVTRWLHPTWTPALLLILSFLACNFPGGTDIPGWQRIIIQSLMTLLLASCVIQEKHWLNGILTFAPIQRIGVISYGMYLLHWIGIDIGERFLKFTGLSFSFDLFLLCFAITYVMSEITFRYYEKPFLDRKKTFSVFPSPAKR